MITTFRSEWILLNRARLWVITGLTTVVFTVVATALGHLDGEAVPAGSRRRARRSRRCSVRAGRRPR